MTLVRNYPAMPLYALEDVDDAVAATKAFLLPVDRTRWAKLALVAFFAAGPGVNANLFQFNAPADAGVGVPPGGLPSLPEFGPRVWLLVALVVAATLLLGALFLLVGSIMEFVLVESLRHEEVAIRRYWGERWRQGVRLFGFRLVLGLLTFGGAAVLAALFVVPLLFDVGPGIGVPGIGLSVVAFVLLLPVVAVLALLVGLLNGFTTVFVVPVMIVEDCGVLAGWRRLWPTITGDPGQFLAYAVVGFVLSIAGGILAAIAVGVAAVLLLIPFGVLGAIGFGLFTVVPPLGVGVLAVVGLLFGLSVLVAVALAQVPVVTYLRYYAMLVLGDVDPELDLVGERRVAIRVESTDEHRGGSA